MSEIFVVLVEDDKVFFGIVHWRELLVGRTGLKCVRADEGIVFVDRNKDFIYNTQSCVDTRHLRL
jgi:hypothetical protein